MVVFCKIYFIFEINIFCSNNVCLSKNFNGANNAYTRIVKI